MTYGIASFLETLAAPPDLIAVGEPTHGEPAFLQVRNDLIATLAQHGLRSVALESDRIAALTASAYVAGEDVPLDPAAAFSHGFGDYPANRDLIVLCRELGLTLYGFDPPLETMNVPSPRAYLRHVHSYLGADGWDEIDGLLGADERWNATEAVMDYTRSVGRSPDAVALRAIADDLLIRLWTRPELSAPGWRAAEANATAALGLLRYHAQCAVPLPQAERLQPLSAIRDALMAQNLLTIRTYEADRGPTLVFAHNMHLRRQSSTIRMGGTDFTWAGAGSIVSSLLGDRYAFLAGSLGTSPVMAIPPPPAGTYEAELGDELAIVPASQVPKAEERPKMQIYFPLDATTVERADGILHVPTGITVDVLAERILALPGVDQQIADGNSRFFFVGPDRRQPFATIVDQDVPGFDEDSQLGRPGVFRLNVELGRTEFERRFGFPPKDFEEHRGEFDFARLDRLFPHPGYALYGWASIVHPGPQMLPLVDELIAHAHARAVDRHERAERRS